MSETSIMTRLKEETWPLHQKAEGGNLEQDLIKGKLPQDIYLNHLGQRYLIHQALEARLRETRPAEPRMMAVVEDYQFQEDRAAEDIRTYGGDPAQVKALPSTEKLLSAIATASPLALMGFQYVFEGSNNGAFHIARVLRRAWNLEGNVGTRYLDPYGDTQREKWAAFRSAMDAQSFTEEEASTIVEAAKATFQQMIEMEDELYPAVA